MTSRASPSRRSSGVTVVSIATVSPASVATAQPARGVWVTITSSAPTGTGPSESPSTVTGTVPPASTAVAMSAAGTAAMAAATAGVLAPNRRPRLRKFGLTA